MLPLACLALGVILGMIGGLRVGMEFMQDLKQRIDELERNRILQKD